MRSGSPAFTHVFLTTRALRTAHSACCAVAVLALAATWPASAQSRMRTYESRYYVLHTDLDKEGVQEAVLRITLMAEEYHRRTKGLGGTVNERLPFYLFNNRSDYEAAGGAVGSAGVFTGDKLMAVVNPSNPEATWHAVQHEGFHQFVHAAIGPGIPVWANEGLAECFGHGLYTGDQFIVGLIPPQRLARVQSGIAQGGFKSLRDMMLTPHETWNVQLRREDYDQAWSMVHFLAHGDNRKYQGAFMGFLRDVSRKTNWEEAWVQNFGGDVNAFQRRWEEYWTGLGEDPTADVYAQAIASTLTSFYARALARRQCFDTIEEFLTAAQAGMLKAHEKDWLPPALLHGALRSAPRVGEWWLERKPGRRLLMCRTKAGTVLEGSFKVRNGRVQSVTVKPKRKRRRAQPDDFEPYEFTRLPTNNSGARLVLRFSFGVLAESTLNEPEGLGTTDSANAGHWEAMGHPIGLAPAAFGAHAFSHQNSRRLAL